MSSYEITAQQKYAYQTGRGWHPDTVPHVLGKALAAQFAARLKAEWLREHDCRKVEDWGDNPSWTHCADLRHDWTDADWLAEADRRLREP